MMRVNLGPSAAHRNILLFILLGLVLILLPACGSFKEYENGMQTYLDSLLINTNRLVLQKEKTGVEHKNLDFIEACTLAVSNNPEIKKQLTELAVSDIELEQIDSYLIPRIDIRSRIDIPLFNDDDDVNVTGGFFIRYDIWNAIFQNDIHAAQMALNRKIHLAIQWIIIQKSFEIYNLLQDIKAQTSIVELNRSILKKAQSGTRIAAAYQKINEAEPLMRLNWQDYIDQERKNVWLAEKVLTRKKRELLNLLRISVQNDISVSMPKVDFSCLYLADQTLKPSDIWLNRIDARLVELDLLQHEMAILKAERQDLPLINPTLGLGNIDVTGDDDSTASVVFGIEFSYNLFDAGNLERNIKKARIKRDMKRKELEASVLKYWRQAKGANAAIGEAKEGLLIVNRSMELAKKRVQGINKLSEEGYLRPTEKLRAQIESDRLNIQLYEAKAKLRQTQAKALLSRGKQLMPGLAKEVFSKLLGKNKQGQAAR